MGPIKESMRTELSYQVVACGAAFIITGVALTCISLTPTHALGSVLLAIGTPLVLGGIIMIFLKKSKERGTAEPATAQAPPPATPASHAVVKAVADTLASAAMEKMGEHFVDMEFGSKFGDLLFKGIDTIREKATAPGAAAAPPPEYVRAVPEDVPRPATSDSRAVVKQPIR